ncbi:MAG: MFS transporter, partial [Muribaculaceae bacterium]|nr:MFS transporter [Muribaculaceae bacterium]
MTVLRDKAWARWTALGLLAFAMFCSYIFMDILSPIKDLLQSTRGWDSKAFGTMQGSETFLNVFIFFLIFAGIILDKLGVRFTALLSGAVMLVGATINWYALTDSFLNSGLNTWFTNHLNYIPGFDELGISPFYKGMPASAKFSAVGFMIFGCGVEMAGITVSRGIVKWFKGKEMALAMGSEMALARLGVATCMIFSPVFAEFGGEIRVSRSVAFGVILLMVALIMFVVYFFMDRKLDSQTHEGEEKDDPFKISDLGKILSSLGFWLVALLCVLYYSAIFPFQKYAVNMLQCNLTFTELDENSFWAGDGVSVWQYVIMLVVAASAFASNFSKNKVIR